MGDTPVPVPVPAEVTVMTDDVQYWYNTRTRQVEKGPQSSWTHRMGPYATESEARAALETAEARNAEWEHEDEKWEGD